MSAAPYFPSGGFHRDQFDNIGVFLVDLDGSPYVASGGTGGGGGGLVQLQLREGAAWVNVPGTAARGLLVDPSNATTDAAVGLPARIAIVGGYDGSNSRVLKTSAAGVLQTDVLSLPAGGATLAEQQSQTTLLTAIRDRLPSSFDADGGLKVHVQNPSAGGGGTQFAEDAALGSTPTGTLAMARRTDTLSTLTPVVDDAVSVRTNNRGALWVAHDGTLAVSGPLTDTQLRASAVPVSGPLTDTQLRASAVAVDTELTTADLDTGAGTDTRAVVGLARAESGGALLVGSANPLPVSGPLTDTQLRATPVPVSGTVTANAGSGPFPINDNGGSLTVDNGGTFAVQDSEKVVDNAAFTDGTTKVLPMGFVFDEVAGTALTENDAAAGRIDSKRAQVLVIEDATTRGQRATVTASNALKVDGSAVTQPVSLAANQSVNVAQMAGTATDTNSGNKSAGTQRVVLATDQPQLTNALKVDGSAVTQPVSGTVTGNLAAAAGATGLSKFHLVSAATTNATNIKASAGKVHGWYIYNSNAAARKVAFHNTAGTPTAGTSVVDAIVIPPLSAANVFSDIGIAFSTGIAITTVTDLTDAGATAVALNDLIINIYYI